VAKAEAGDHLRGSHNMLKKIGIPLERDQTNKRVSFKISRVKYTYSHSPLKAVDNERFWIKNIVDPQEIPFNRNLANEEREF